MPPAEQQQSRPPTPLTWTVGVQTMYRESEAQTGRLTLLECDTLLQIDTTDLFYNGNGFSLQLLHCYEIVLSDDTSKRFCLFQKFNPLSMEKFTLWCYADITVSSAFQNPPPLADCVTCYHGNLFLLS